MAESGHQAPKPRSRGIYLLPNLITTAAMFAGFYAIIAAQNGRYHGAAVALFLAMFLDAVDGRVARMTNTQTEFGAQYDSLADLVSFGVAPALVMYQWSLQYMNDVGPGWAKPGWLAAFFFTAAAAMRLARFNTNSGTDKRYFIGLPSPTAAALVIGFVWVCHDMNITGESMRVLSLPLMLVAAALMVSNIPYLTFKDIDYRQKVPFIGMMIAALIMMLLAFDPPKVLFAGFLIYASWGPMVSALRWRKRRIKR